MTVLMEYSFGFIVILFICFRVISIMEVTTEVIMEVTTEVIMVDTITLTLQTG